MLRRTSLAAAFAALLVFAFAGVSLAGAAPLNVNTASAEQLQTVKGVGTKTAAKIIAERKKNGPFATLSDMQARVKGVGAKTILHFKEAGWVASGAKAAPAAGKQGKKGKKAKKGKKGKK